MDELEASQPRIIGMYVAITMMDNARKLAEMIRERLPGAVLVCGGPMPTVNPERFVPGFDIVFRGEAVQSFPRFCVDYLKSGRLEDVLSMRSRYPGISFLENGALVQVPVRPSRKKELDRLPVPDLRDFDHAGYQQFWKERSGYSPACIMTTYGCPYDCDFCSKPIFGRYYRPGPWKLSSERSWPSAHRDTTGCGLPTTVLPFDIDHVRRFCRMLIRKACRWPDLSLAGRAGAGQRDRAHEAGGMPQGLFRPGIGLRRCAQAHEQAYHHGEGRAHRAALF